MNNRILTIAASSILLSFFGCQPEIELGQLDESKYQNATKVTAGLFDSNSGKRQNIVELRKEDYNSSLYVGLNKAPKKGVDMLITFDAEYLDEYNEIHGTSFQLYPEDKVRIGEDGKIVVAPDEKRSYPVDFTISPDFDLLEGITYAVPLKVETVTEGVETPFEAQHCVYLVKNYFSQSDCDKGAHAVKTFLYYGANPLNISQFEMENGKLLFDVVCLFAANINYDSEKGNIYVNLNQNLQHLLDNSERYFAPLQKRGVKVLLGLLGNHDESGLAQLSDLGCQEFARQLAEIVEAYNLDGVNFDDEYSKSPDLANPLFASRSKERGARLCYETKSRMPDKLVTVYDWGQMYGHEEIEGVPASEWIDICVGDYGRVAYPIGGMNLKSCSGASTELAIWAKGSDQVPAYSRNCIEGGYGYYMLFDLYGGASNNYNKQIDRMRQLAEHLYGSTLKEPELYYELQSFEPIPNPYLVYAGY